MNLVNQMRFLFLTRLNRPRRYRALFETIQQCQLAVVRRKQ